jgi:hypothetical protein
LLPNRFRALVYDGFESAVNARGGVFLHSRHHVRIQIHRDPDLRVPEALAGDLGMHAGRQHVGRVRVSQVVEANARQRLGVRQQLMPLVGDGSRLQRAAVGLGNDKGVVRQGNAEL